MVVADGTGFPVVQSCVGRESGSETDRRILGSVFVPGWLVKATETGRTSILVLLVVRLVLKTSGSEVLIFSIPEVEMGIDAVVSKGLNVLISVGLISSVEAREYGKAGLVPVTVIMPRGVDKEPDSALDAKDEVVPAAEVVSGEPVTFRIEVVSFIAQGPDVGAEAVVGGQVGGCSRADVLVSAAKVLSMVLTLLSGLDVGVRTEVVMVVVTLGAGAVVALRMLTSAGDEVCDSCSVIEAASLVTALVMATRVLDPIEGNTPDGEELIFPPEASLAGLAMAWLLKVRDADVACSLEVRCNVSVASRDAP